MGCCLFRCCKKGKVKTKTDKELSHSKNELFKNSEKEESPEKKLISDEHLDKELKHIFKAGDSSYSKQNIIKIKANDKKMSETEYKSNNNQKSLVDDNPKEFAIVKKFLEKKDYKLICCIGSGTYSEVYKAFSKKHNKNVAVKVIRLSEQSENYRIKFLPREVSVLQDCKHPNIIKMYEMCQFMNKVYMIMEFAHKGTLADWLKTRGTLSEPTAHLMYTKILEALHHMHSRQIAHRDLKLENILITALLQPKLSDFSFAVRVDSKDWKSTTHCGSLPYLAPELLQRKPYNPLISDIWSLGVCFYIMLNDSLPFTLKDDRLMLKQQLNREWKFKDKVEAKLSPELKSMIKSMLDPNTQTRVTTAQLRHNNWIKKFKALH